MEWIWKTLHIIGQGVSKFALKHMEVTQLSRKDPSSATRRLENCVTRCYTQGGRGDCKAGGGESVHTVFDVAKYVLKKCGSMTTMKLQKLVYYCQAWSLAWDEVPLFEEDFEAWANGPVCPQLFDKHRGVFVMSPNFFSDLQSAEFTHDEVETMDIVLSTYGDKEPQWLSDLTHSELPWKEARRGYPPGALCSNVVSKESMQQYYGGL